VDSLVGGWNRAMPLLGGGAVFNAVSGSIGMGLINLISVINKSAKLFL
jgi:hypothetical protein